MPHQAIRLPFPMLQRSLCWGYCLLIALALLPAGCAYENDEGETSANDIIEVRMTFADPVNPERFFYYLVFNFDEVDSHTPFVDIDAFQDRGRIGENWDIYYVYGRPGEPQAPQPVAFYKGFGGNDYGLTDGPLRTDNRGTKYIDVLPQRPFDASSLEFISATVVSGSTNPGNPSVDIVNGNTLQFQFRAIEFPIAPFSLPRTGKAKVAMFVTNQGIDDVSNPDDLIDDCVVFDEFIEDVVFIDLTQKPEWTEDTDPQENFEEVRLPRNPPLEGPFKAADLVNWSIKLIDQ